MRCLRVRYYWVREQYVEGVNKVSPKERERRLAKHLVDRSHRTRNGHRRRRPPPWTREKRAELVLSLALLFAAVILVVVPFVLST